jgi:hypothetical protein
MTLAIACDDDDPARVQSDPPPPISAYTGTFQLHTNNYGTEYIDLTRLPFTVAIDSALWCVMKNADLEMQGAWDNDLKRVTAQSRRITVTEPKCSREVQYTAHLTYSTTDKFTGTIYARHGLSSHCTEPNPYQLTYTVEGRRVP